MSTKKTVALLASLLLLCFLHPVAGLFAKSYVDLFAHGYSSSKALLLPLFLLLVLGLDRFSPITPTRVVLSAFVINSGATHLLAVAEQLWLNRRFALEPLEPLTALKNGFWSTSGLTHIHISKTLLAPLVQNVERFTDAGYPFDLLVPPAVSQLHLVLFLSSLALAVLTGLWAFRERPPGEATSLCLTVFAITKTAIDGGPLCSEFLSALCIFSALIWGKRSLPFTGGLLLAHLVALESTPLTMLLWGYPSNLFMLSFPYALERCSNRPGIRRVWLIGLVAVYLSPLLVGWLIPAFARQPYGLNLWQQGLRLFKPGSELWILSTRPEILPPASLEVRGTRQIGPYTQIHAEVRSDITLMELWQAYQLPPSRQTVEWHNQGLVLEAEIQTLHGRVDPLPTSPLVQGATLSAPSPTDGYQRLRLELSTGSSPDLAFALLGPQLTLLRRIRIQRTGPGLDAK